MANGFGSNFQVRTFNGIDLDTLEYKKLDGLQRVNPPGDLSGKWHEQGAETVTKSA
jgi:hypothetical protein